MSPIKRTAKDTLRKFQIGRRIRCDSWMVTKICNVPEGTPVLGITLDDYRNLYFTNEDGKTHTMKIRHAECYVKNGSVWKFNMEDHKQVPQKLFSNLRAHLTGLVWNRSDNSLYICDKQENRILKYEIDNNIVSTFAADFYTRRDNPEEEFQGIIEGVHMSSPEGIVIDKNGDLIVSALSHVLKLKLHEQMYENIAGDERTCFYRDGKAIEAYFYGARSLALTEDGSIYVAASSDSCIRLIKDGMVSTVVGKHVTEKEPTGNALRDYKLRCPFYLALEPNGNLLVVDTDKESMKDKGTNRKIIRIDFQKQRVKEELANVAGFSAITTDGKGNFYIGANNSILLLECAWKYDRLLWIGHLKEEPTNCNFACIPKDIIKEILKHC